MPIHAPPLKSLLRKAGMLASRRREQRLPCQRPVRILCGFDPVDAVLVQCSPHGIAVVSPVAIAAGEQFMIQVSVRSLALLVYTVRHCQPVGNDQFRLGSELVDARVPKGTTLAAILDALLNPAPAGRS